MRCLACKYDLKNLTEHRCPECGRAFDPTNPKTFDTGKRKRTLWVPILIIAIVSYAIGLPVFWYEYETNPPPPSVNTSIKPNGTLTVQAIFIPQLHYVVTRALFNWPMTFMLMFAAYMCATWASKYFRDAITWHKSER